ncbi:MAG TPA: hypothetical protein PKL31_06175 [Fulvivirga sp.]|nr:hypothetical protein [Fulvivirga sp.]
MRILLILILAPLYAVNAQPNTEVYLFDLNKSGGLYSISNPYNVSAQNPGYDNQPHFAPDRSLLYTGARNGQTDVIRFDLATKKSTNETNTPQNEYSPTPVPNQNTFSCIYDSIQNLVKYSPNSSREILIADLVVGYHSWFDDKTVVVFALGDVFTLQSYNIETKVKQILDENIGRSLHKIPGQDRISYISKKSDPWTIISINPLTGSKKTLATTLEGVEDMAWTPDGMMLMGKGNKLYQFDAMKGWLEIADLSVFNLSGITRLAVSPDGQKIAVVVNE